MLVWACNEQRRLVRIIPPRNSKESIVSQLFQENRTPQMDHPGSQQPLFNPNVQGIPANPQGLHEPPQHGDGVALLATPAVGGGNVNFQRNQYRQSCINTCSAQWGKHPNFSWRNEGGPHNLPNNQGPNYQNQGFSNPAPQIQSQGLQGFPVNPNQSFHPSNQGNPNP